MTDRDKLIQDLLPITDNYLNTSEDKHFTPNTTIADVADLLIEKGWIRPPCKVGDKIYRIAKDSKTIIEEQIGLVNVEFIIDNGTGIQGVWWLKDYNIGKTVFLTKEEAEAKMKELNKNAKR